MDMEKFIKLLLNDKELKDIPLAYVSKVVCSVFRILEYGNVFYKEEL